MLVAVLFAGCATAPTPVADGPCADAYDGVVASLEQMFRQSGTPLPVWPDRAEYVRQCEALALSPEQLHCLDPAAVSADPAGCRDATRPVQAEVDRLAKWFGDHTKRVGEQR
ncbi:MAG: hypothetical protein KC621_15095 [Myxococcales bacterium]|nr:hypothetical protein [Myxococcales bacterium]